MYGYYDGDFEANGKAFAKAHYVDMEDYARDHGREYLEWCEEDGWWGSSLVGYELCHYGS